MIEAAENRTKALDLRLAGLTYRQIGEKMGYSEQRAHQVVMSELDRLNKERSEKAEDVRQLELGRMDTLWISHFHRARQGDEKALAGCMRIMERRARLLGLDAPVKTENVNLDAPLEIKMPESFGKDPEPEESEETNEGE